MIRKTTSTTPPPGGEFLPPDREHQVSQSFIEDLRFMGVPEATLSEIERDNAKRRARSHDSDRTPTE